jgi:hypothetical protein
VIVAKELREVVEEDEKNSKCAAVQTMHRLSKFRISGNETQLNIDRRTFNKQKNKKKDKNIHRRKGLRNLKRAVSSCAYIGQPFCCGVKLKILNVRIIFMK